MKNFISKLLSRRNLTIVLLTIVGFFGFLFALNYGLEKYNQNKQWQEIKKSAEAFQKAEQELSRQMMADTYGGKTPQETLDMFIAAVEKGDYELASKYFVIARQKEWNVELKKIKEVNKVEVFLKPVSEAKNSNGEYSDDKQSYSVYNPISVDFILYPNGIWKISEI